jgi:hypothetical protein
MIRVVFVAALAGACQYNPREIDGDDVPDAPPGTSDARVDAEPGDPCMDWSFTPAQFDPCGIPGPNDPNWDNGLMDIDSQTWELDGDTGVLRHGAAMTDVPYAVIDGVAVFSVDHLVISSGATLRGLGARPIAIVSWTSIDIDGTLDVASRTNAPGIGPGAGASSANCPLEAAGPQTGTPSANGDGGAGGGGFGDAGGAGGTGDTTLGIGGAGGMGRLLAVPPRLEGGCRGADASGDNGTPGTGGAGGGAILLVARVDLVVNGVIHAGGAGGVGATDGGRTGGGGGGSGGMIELEAATITIADTATLAANGGQGGGGNDGNDALPGADGEASDVPAFIANNEGQGDPDGGAGGAIGATMGQPGSGGTRGGGGGGGGVGYIIYRAHPTVTLGTATISPAASPF